MAVKVYGVWSSPFVKSVLFTLHEKNVEFELMPSDITVMKSDEFLATKNPFGRMPAFQDGEVTLFESRAIARYIEGKYEGRGTPLMGSSPTEQALVNVWIDVEIGTFLASLWPICVELYLKKIQDKALIAACVEKLNKVLEIYEDRLSKHKYLAGDFFSLADLFHVPTVHMFFCLADDALRTVITSWARVHAWYQDIVARPAWQKIVRIPEASDWSHIQKI